MRRLTRWIALVPLAAAAAVLGVAIAEKVAARPAGAVPWVEPSAVELDAFPVWADPRWRIELEALLAAWPAFRADDAAALAALEADLRALAFAAEVDRPHVDRGGGLRIGLRLRRPVAAVPVHAGFLTVDAAGVLLPGTWPSPPRRGDLWLPVIRPRLPGEDEAAGRKGGEGYAFDFAAPGDWLLEPAHVAALDVALSLAQHLSPAELARLGRVALDGSDYAVRGPGDLGVVIEREDGRRILFGRPPSVRAPGELPARDKWRAVAEALERLEDPRGEGAWDLCDVRWDVPELRLAAEAAAEVVARRPPPAAEAGFAIPAGWRTDVAGGESPREPAERRSTWSREPSEEELVPERRAGARGGGRVR